MKKYIILIPLFNDWKSVSKLLTEIDSQVTNLKAEVSVIIVNDASTESRSNLNSVYKKIKFIKILNMKENRASSRCIAAGLKYVNKNENFDRVIVMDADGEDRPEELQDFFKKAEENPDMTITGNRFKRSEGIIFRFLYEVHKILTLIFTGKLIKFGNFTCLPKDHVAQLIEKSYLWNSYSGSVVRAIKNKIFIRSVRGYRYVLPSKMNLFSLIFHSLTIISTFRNIVIFRVVIFFLIYFFLIFKDISLLNFLPIIFLLIFFLIIVKISLRSNEGEFNKCLENIGTIDILDNSNNR